MKIRSRKSAFLSAVLAITLVGLINQSKAAPPEDTKIPVFNKVVIYVEALQCHDSGDEQDYLHTCYDYLPADQEIPASLDPRNMGVFIQKMYREHLRSDKLRVHEGGESSPSIRQDQPVILLSEKDVQDGKGTEYSRDPDALIVRVRPNDFPFDLHNKEQDREIAILIGLSVYRIRSGVDHLNALNSTCLFNSKNPDIDLRVASCLSTLVRY